MMPVRERYRKLPGHRRGILRGASVWIAGDHLLSVRSYRVREEYKRFQFGDVQALVVARCPRFHISTRSLFIAFVWLCAYGVGRQLLPQLFQAAMWFAGAALVCAWLYISFAHSCRCRILTAVSSDDLPSVYRIWTARRFLSQVEPRIAEVQGGLAGNWFEAVDARTIGPASAPPPATDHRPPATGRRSPSSLAPTLFVALLFVNSATMLLTLHSSVTLVLWLTSLLVLAEVVAMVPVFVEHHRGVLRPGIQRLAIATVVKIGVAYYAAMAVMSAASATNPAMDRAAMIALPPYVLLRQIDAWVNLALGLVGAVLLLGSGYSE